MKYFRGFIFIGFALALFFSCSKEEDTILPQSPTSPTTQTVPQDGLSKAVINPNRGNYDLVVVDIDRWEICLNADRIRRNVTSYQGHLWYQMGSFMFEGRCSASYNPVWGTLTVVALDSGWDRGHIVYELKFVNENSDNMEGTFFYYEYTNRVNWIDAWLDQGQLGTHDAGPYPGKALPKEMIEYAPNEHPKKRRYELENND